MCTAGVVAQVIAGSDGQPAWSAIRGTIFGFNLAVDDAGVAGPYDAVGRKFTGFALISTFRGSPSLAAGESATVGTNGAPHSAGRRERHISVQRAGHYEIRWPEVGGHVPWAERAAFDPDQLTSIRFHVVPNTSFPIPYGFCIRNTAFLMD